MQIVLVEPEIPPNTGNIARLCAGTNTTLHLIEPLGFELRDREVRRAGMDYWQHVKWRRWSTWAVFEQSLPAGARAWFIESGGPRHYAAVRYGPDDYLVFGRETAGLPKSLLAERPDTWVRIPMFHSQVRSLNLSNCVALVLYEALRQHGFVGEI